MATPMIFAQKKFTPLTVTTVEIIVPESSHLCVVCENTFTTLDPDCNRNWCSENCKREILMRENKANLAIREQQAIDKALKSNKKSKRNKKIVFAKVDKGKAPEKRVVIKRKNPVPAVQRIDNILRKANAQAKKSTKIDYFSVQNFNPLCPHLTKKSFDTHVQAWKWIDVNHSKFEKIFPYRCDCKSIHIGHEYSGKRTVINRQGVEVLSSQIK